MKQYRKKPVVIEAAMVPTMDESYQWGLLAGWLGTGDHWKLNEDGTISITTLEGVMTANVGDFIIRGVQGEFYPCKPMIFEATYEGVG